VQRRFGCAPLRRFPYLSRPQRKESTLKTTPLKFDWINASFLVAAHLLAGLAVFWAYHRPDPRTLVLGFAWLVLCSLGITAGYHRLFSHRTYQAAAWLRAVLLLFGAAAIQNSALNWVNNHRVHHSKVDRAEDPYNIKQGFWWAHIGWVLFWDPNQELRRVRDLQADPLVVLQHRYYVPIGIFMGGILPALFAALWGDFIGGLLIAGFLRLILQYHATFATNSVAHTLGSRPYDRGTSARDHSLTALFTFGEGYHNFHHRFENDYRNGVRLWHFDPTKWLIFGLSLVGATKNLRRAPEEKIVQARRAAKQAALAA
jgi:stearoyl-CoA desaturase (Delta-9 desaturase)